MFSLLEDLRPEFARALGRQIHMSELTVISLQLSPRQAFVVTNRNCYFLVKRVLGLKIITQSLGDITEIQVAGRELCFLLVGERKPLRVSFFHRPDMQAPVYNRMQTLLVTPEE